MIKETYTTGSYDRYGDSRGYVLELVLTEESTDAAANTSTVSYTLQLLSGDGNRFDWELTSTLSINGTQVATKTQEHYLDYNSAWVLLSGTTTVPHDDDGTAALEFSATVTPWNGGNTYTPPTLTLSDTLTLTQIPRESTIAATGAYIGESTTIAISRSSSAFTHSIHYQFGGLSGYLQNSTGTIGATERKLTATTVVFPVPESFYAQIPNDARGQCTLTCKTYSGTTQIGQAKTATFTVTADPARCRPTLSATAADIHAATLALTGNSRIFVAGKSRVRCTISAQSRHSAAIAELFVNGRKVTQNPVILENIQTAAITVRAVDTRGYSVEYTVPGLQLVAYVPLSAQVQASRTDPTGSTGQMALSGKWFSGSFGAVANTLTARYCIDGGSWQSISAATAGGNISAQVSLSGLDYRTGYTITVQLSDKLETLSKTCQLHKGLPVFDWGENDVCFHVPVHFTAADGTKFKLTFANGQLKGERV